MQADGRVHAVEALGEADREPRAGDVDADADDGRRRRPRGPRATAPPASSSISRWQWESMSVMGSGDGRTSASGGRQARNGLRRRPRCAGRAAAPTTTAAGVEAGPRGAARAADRRRRAPGRDGAGSRRPCRGSPGRWPAPRGAGRPPAPCSTASRRPACASSLASFHGASSSTRRLRRRTYSQTRLDGGRDLDGVVVRAGGAHHRLALGRHLPQHLARGRRRDASRRGTCRSCSRCGSRGCRARWRARCCSGPRSPRG